MIIDCTAPDAPKGRDFDVVLVGGGTVALYLAWKLGTSGIRTLVLESGGCGFESTSQALNAATQDGRWHQGLSDARARMLGGTSNLWGGQLTPFTESDFEARPGVSAAPWPIRFDELASHYNQVAFDLELGEPLSVNSVEAEKLFSGRLPKSKHIEPFFTQWLREPRFAKLFAGVLADCANVEVWTHAHVTDIAFAEGSSRARSLRVVLGTGESADVQGEHVVLANGTVETSRLLLAVAASNPSAPWSHNYWLGRGFQDHLDLRGARVHLDPEGETLVQNIMWRGRKYQPKFRWARAAENASGLAVACSFAFESSSSEHLQYLKTMVRSALNGQVPRNVRSFGRHLVGAASVWWPMVRQYVAHRRIYSSADRGTWLTVHCEQMPLASSQISLSPDRVDRYGMPLANLHWQIGGDEELRAIATFVNQLSEDLRPYGIHIKPHPSLVTGDRQFLETARDSFHQCGGARMGHDASDGVVDRDLKIFGCDNVFVAGAAVFRTSSYANPTFTALAFASRLANHLASLEKGK